MKALLGFLSCMVSSAATLSSGVEVGYCHTGLADNRASSKSCCVGRNRKGRRESPVLWVVGVRNTQSVLLSAGLEYACQHNCVDLHSHHVYCYDGRRVKELQIARSELQNPYDARVCFSAN